MPKKEATKNKKIIVSNPKEKENTNKPSSALSFGSVLKFNNYKNVIIVGISIILTAILFFFAIIVNSPTKIVTTSNIYQDDEQVTKSNLAQGELPQFFPSDFPIYDGAQLENNWTTQSEKVTGVSLAWKTNDAPVKVFNYYFTELQSLGYEVEVLSQTDSAYTLSFEKESVSGFIGIALADKNTLISVTLGIRNGQ